MLCKILSGWAWTIPHRKRCRAFLVHFRQGPPLFPVQAFVTEPSMEALHKPVLPRAARFNIILLESICLQLPRHDLRDELRAVVTAQIRGRPVAQQPFVASTTHPPPARPVPPTAQGIPAFICPERLLAFNCGQPGQIRVHLYFSAAGNNRRRKIVRCFHAGTGSKTDRFSGHLVD